MKKALLAVATLVLFPALARAGVPLMPDVYVLGKIGAAIPEHENLRGFDNGLAFEGTVGWKLAPVLAMEASLGHFKLSGSQSAYDPATGFFVNAAADLSATSVTGSLKAIAPLPLIDLYALAGVGVYFVSASMNAPGYGSMSDSANTLGVHVGGGVSFHPAPLVTLGAEAKYVIASADLFGATSRIDSLILGGTLGVAF